MLERLLTYWKEGLDDDIDVITSDPDFYKRLLERQWRREREAHDKVSMSQLGKPVVLQWLHKHYPVEERMTGRLRYIFSVGDFFEQLVLDVCVSLGFKVEGAQDTYKYFARESDDLFATGHVDSIITDGDERAVVEVKTMSDYYCKQFLKTPNDERGYLTQLSLYSSCTGLPGYWLIVNKGTNELHVVPLPDENYEDLLERAEDAIYTLHTAKSLEDVYEQWGPPEAEPEKHRRSLTGAYKVPSVVRYSPYRHCLYDIDTRKNGYYKPTDYVEAYVEPVDAEERARALVQRAVCA